MPVPAVNPNPIPNQGGAPTGPTKPDPVDYGPLRREVNQMASSLVASGSAILSYVDGSGQLRKFSPVDAAKVAAAVLDELVALRVYTKSVEDQLAAAQGASRTSTVNQGGLDKATGSDVATGDGGVSKGKVVAIALGTFAAGLAAGVGADEAVRALRRP